MLATIAAIVILIGSDKMAAPIPAYAASPAEADDALAKKGVVGAAPFIAKAKTELDLTLVDYPAARFRSVRIGWRDGIPVACGLINMKNRSGGYNGWQPFLAADNLYAFDLLIDQETSYAYRHFCLGPTAWIPGDQSAAIAAN